MCWPSCPQNLLFCPTRGATLLFPHIFSPVAAAQSLPHARPSIIFSLSEQTVSITCCGYLQTQQLEAAAVHGHGASITTKKGSQRGEGNQTGTSSVSSTSRNKQSKGKICGIESFQTCMENCNKLFLAVCIFRIFIFFRECVVSTHLQNLP